MRQVAGPDLPCSDFVGLPQITFGAYFGQAGVYLEELGDGDQRVSCRQDRSPVREDFGTESVEPLVLRKAGRDPASLLSAARILRQPETHLPAGRGKQSERAIQKSF